MSDFAISIRASEKIVPVALMRVTEISSPDAILEKGISKEDLVVEGKLDGFKVQVIKTKGEIRIYTRRGKEKTDNFPYLVEALSFLPDNTLVEGELIYVTPDGIQNIGTVTTLVNSLAEKSIDAAKKLPGKIKFYVYDILWHKGKNVTDRPFSIRRQLLEKTIKPNKYIQITKQYPFSKWQDTINEAVKSGGEGIVLKILSKPYVYGAIGENEPKPKGIIYKYKKSGGKSDSDDYVVFDYKISSKGKLNVLFGQYYKGKLYHISELSNFSKENEEIIKRKLKKGHFTIEVKFQERVPGGLRSQAFVRFREDKAPKDATMSEYHVKYVKNFELVKKAFLLSKRHKLNL